MVFTSHIFVFYFLPLTLLAYYLLPWRRNLFLLFASYLFYGWWYPWFVGLMFFSTAVNYACGRVIADNAGDEKRRKAALTASVVVSLSLLGFFKYFVFFQNNVNTMLAWMGTDAL